ncbi:hypothetical protein BCD64_06895 [Nostoc sp. MBR 210]|nr:hypothetical protein BCD64_06895 [Nostoc sp. MBR 210]
MIFRGAVVSTPNLLLNCFLIRKIAISCDGTFLASGGDDNTLILWNLRRILKLNALSYACFLV